MDRPYFLDLISESIGLEYYRVSLHDKNFGLDWRRVRKGCVWQSARHRHSVFALKV